KTGASRTLSRCAMLTRCTSACSATRTPASIRGMPRRWHECRTGWPIPPSTEDSNRMAEGDRSRWDGIYRQRNHLPYPDPDPLLFEYTPPLTTSYEKRALDLAGGLGQNGLWLAQQGYV